MAKKIIKIGTIKTSEVDLPNEFHIRMKLKGKQVHKSEKAYTRKQKHKKGWNK